MGWLPKCPTTGKSSFRGKDDALHWIRRRLGHQRRRGWRPPHRAYQCPHCGHWHLTKLDKTPEWGGKAPHTRGHPDD